MPILWHKSQVMCDLCNSFQPVIYAIIGYSAPPVITVRADL